MKLKIYFEEVYKELVQKVSWPSWSELQSSAIVVMIASAIIAFVISIMDLGFKNVMEFIYSLFY